MRLGNQINAGTNSNGFTSFNTIISSTGTSPTKGTIIIDTSYYFLLGKLMIIEYTYVQSPNTGSAGSGDYLFSIPPGYTINTTIAPVYNASNNTKSLIGSARADNVNLSTGYGFVYNSTNYGLFIVNTTSGAAVVSSVFQQIGSSQGANYGASLIIPIL